MKTRAQRGAANCQMIAAGVHGIDFARCKSMITTKYKNVDSLSKGFHKQPSIYIKPHIAI